jgi:hypothetical protein
LLKQLQIVFVSRMSEAIDAALEVLVANPPPLLPTAQRDVFRPARRANAGTDCGAVV